jgi:voltage-gated potassium channel
VVEFLDFIMLQSIENVTLEEVSCEDMAIWYDGRSIRELDARHESGANIVGMKRADGSFVINPLPEVMLYSSDKLFVLGTNKQIDRLKTMLTTHQQSEI